MAENENQIVVAGGIRYRAEDAKQRGLKPDSAAHAKKIAEGTVPVGTLAGGKTGVTRDENTRESIPGPVAGDAGSTVLSSDATGNAAPPAKK